ncbi:MAG: hypothetical protein IH974_00740, partial [Myxococcales bacterium]|nr:hypothetical protein [Myxococcales bacterium]
MSKMRIYAFYFLLVAFSFNFFTVSALDSLERAFGLYFSLKASNPYAKRGVLYQHYKDYFGKDDPDVLVWHGETRSMNSAISQKFVDKQYERDPIKAAAEYGAQFRADIEDFVR